jgi:hypothetical protein
MMTTTISIDMIHIDSSKKVDESISNCSRFLLTNKNTHVSLVILGSSLIVLRTHNKIDREHLKSSEFDFINDQLTSLEHTRLSEHTHSIPLRIRPIFIYIRSMILLILIHSCGSLVPSVISAFYFFVCLGLTCWWAFGKHFSRVYLHIIRLLQIYSACHLLIIYLYQLPFIVEYFRRRYHQTVHHLGFHVLYQHQCLQKINEQHVNRHWIIYLHPFIVLTLYWISIYEYYVTNKHRQHHTIPWSSNAHVSLPNLVDKQVKHSHYVLSHLQSIVDLFWKEPSNDDINRHTHSFTDDNMFYKTDSLLVAFIAYVLSKGYMFSILAMLFWSITYHSYFTFIYLVLACLIWLAPRSEYYCHRLSPFICIYAYVLLTINYIKLLNLIDKKYDMYMYEIQLFYPSDEYSSTNISLRNYFKCSMKFFYTLLLLLTLRQRTHDRFKRQGNRFVYVFYSMIHSFDIKMYLCLFRYY